MGQTVVEKIAQDHLVSGPEDRPLRTGDFVTLRPRHVMTHDNTAAVMKKLRSIGARRIHNPSQPVFTLDHDIQNRSASNLAKYSGIEAFAKEHGVDFYPAGSGIGHQLMCEQLYVVPGAFVVASDSHANMYGALGAVGTPVVRTDAAALWATGEMWWQIPRSVQVVLEGALPDGASGKDVIVALCGRYNKGEVLNAAVELVGPGVASLSMDERMTIANMTTEWGALVGWFPVDATTLAFLRQRRALLDGAAAQRIDDEQLARWEAHPPGPDPDARYAARITFDLSQVTPHVSGPDSVQVMTALSELEPQKVAVHKAYLVSCVNSRLEDLEAAAKVLRGKQVAEGVELYVAAASREVQQAAEASGAWEAIVRAGATPLPPGCGPCIGLGVGVLQAGEVGISATNRNFSGRMGSPQARAYLASPAVVAASALAGTICGPQPLPRRELATEIRLGELQPLPDEQVRVVPGFPEVIRGRLIFVPADNLNTDGIYGNDYTYREDMTPEMMAGVAMENYDPEFGRHARAGDVLVGGWNFGTGSSREQAVTCLQAKGIALIVAGSYSQTYLRNAFNNGYVCVTCPPLITQLRRALASDIDAGTKTIVPGDELLIDFRSATITFRGKPFRFSPLGEVPQSLVVAGGLAGQVQQRLAAPD